MRRRSRVEPQLPRARLNLSGPNAEKPFADRRPSRSDEKAGVFADGPHETCARRRHSRPMFPRLTRRR